MSDEITTRPVRKATLEVTINRANGTKEHLGVIAGYHRNPIINLAMQIAIKTRGLIRRYGKRNHK